MGKVLALVAVMLSGCATASDGTRYVQAHADERWNAVVMASAQAWTDAGCPIVVGAEGVEVHFVAFGALPCRDGGVCGGTWDGESVWIRNDKADGETGLITRHEFGHMLGFPHRSYGIMHPIALMDTVTAEDCDESLHR